LSVEEETKEITLHSVNLKYSSIAVKQEDKELTCSFATTETTIVISLSDVSAKKGVALEISAQYSGVLDDSMAGFYRSNYKGRNGEDKFMGVTQFEPADARKAFPCLDEPLRKAVFSISFVVAKDLDVLSNMPISSEEPQGDGKKLVVFGDTPRMSTYLVAFAVGEFDFVEKKTKHDITVRILAPPGNKDKLAFALDVGAFTLDFFTDYFNVAYPLPKADMLAVNDFAAGAMENWGLITYRLTAILANEQSSVAAQMRVAEVVSHELAHQWFGNLVTMKWWDNLWLNEGFATYLATFAVAQKCPQWDPWTDFVVVDVGQALSLDSLKNTHPIQTPVNTVEEIEEIFDAISYSKGGTVLRMLYHYIGDKAFKTGLNDYLSKFSFKNATSEDLWDCWGASSSKNVREFMAQWTSVPGFPFIEVEQREDGSLLLTQNRFFADGGKEEKESIWPIPFRVVSNAEHFSKETIYMMKEKTLVLPSPGEGHYVKLNSEQMAMAHVKYPDDLLQRMVLTELSPIDRIGLLTDALALAKARKQSTTTVLNLLAKFEKEENPIVWNKISQVITTLLTTFRGETTITDAISKFAANLAAVPLKKIGWEKKEGESDLITKMRATVISLSGLSNKETIGMAIKLLGNHTTLTNDLLGVVFALAVKNGGEKEWDAVQKIFLDVSQVAEVKVKALAALGQNEELMEKTLDWLKSGDIKNQDIYMIVHSCSHKNPTRFFKWFVANWEFVKAKFTGVYMLFTRIIEYAVAYMNTEEDLKAAEEFFKSEKVTAAEMTLKQAFEAIRIYF
jgi:aminopeptidase N